MNGGGSGGYIRPHQQQPRNSQQQQQQQQQLLQQPQPQPQPQPYHMYSQQQQQQQRHVQRPVGDDPAMATHLTSAHPAANVSEAMVLDGRSVKRRFGISMPWASYCMLRPFVSASAAAAETGRIVGRVAPSSAAADLLVPQVLHTLDKAALPRTLVPVALSVSSLPPDAFVAYFLVVRMLDGRTLRCFHRFSEVKSYVSAMARVLGAPLVEIAWFPWRNLHPSLVDVDARRRKLEGYLNMLFAHNAQLQSHPLTAAFFGASGAMDLTVGVTLPPPMPRAGNHAPRLPPPLLPAGSDSCANSPLAAARAAVSSSKRLVTLVVDGDLIRALAQPRASAAAAADALVDKLRAATHGDDMSELRVISIVGIAPPAVSAACHQALVQELGPVRGQPAFSDEPNLQLLRSLHAGDASGEGLVSSLSLGASLSQLGVHLSPEVTSDILLQSYVDGETQALWRAAGVATGPQPVDYHTFLSLLLARTQPPSLSRPGDNQCLAAVANAAAGTHWLACGAAASRPANASPLSSPLPSAVDVSTGAAVDAAAMGLQKFSLVVLVSAHAGGAVSAAGGASKGAGGNIAPMVEGSAAFLDFKSKCERGLELTVHKIKWPRVASAVHKAVGIAPHALANDGASGGGLGGPGHAGGGSSAAVSPFHDVNRPFLVARVRTLRATDGWTKLVWFKQGLKGAVAKVNRAFHNGLRPSEQPGAGVFDLLQVTQVRVVENPTSPLGRWFLFKNAAGPPGRPSFSATSRSGGSFVGADGAAFVALVGLRESLYVECSSRPERDWLVAGFRQLLFGAEGRARARALAYGRALEQPRAHSPQAMAAMSAASGAASSFAASANAEAAGAAAVQLATTTGHDPRNLQPPSAAASYVFALFDADSNGSLDLVEASRALAWAGFAEAGPAGDAEVRRLFLQFDADASGGLDACEFSALMVALEHPEDAATSTGDLSLLERFRTLDVGGGGHLTEFELGQWLGAQPERAGKPVDDAEVRRVLAAADGNGDGKIDFGEFVKLTRSTQQL